MEDVNVNDSLRKGTSKGLLFGGQGYKIRNSKTLFRNHFANEKSKKALQI